MSYLATWLRARRFSEPTFGPSRDTNHWKNTVLCDFPNISRTCLFFLLYFPLSASSSLCFSSLHMEVWQLNFLRLFRNRALQSISPYYKVLLRTTRIYLYYTWTIQYNVRSDRGDAKHIVTATFMSPFGGHWNVQSTVRSNSWSLNCNFTTVLSAQWHEMSKGFIQRNACFATTARHVQCGKFAYRYIVVRKNVSVLSSGHGHHVSIEKTNIYTVLDIRGPRKDQRVVRHFWRPMPAKRRKGCSTT